MISYISAILLLSASAAFAQSPVVNTNGFDGSDANLDKKEESWLQKNDRYIFVIVLSLLSIRGMRRRLAHENQGHMMMIQGVNHGGGFPETVPVDHNGFQKMPDYSVPQQKEEQYTHRY
ncbi:unnamed protein product [Mucor hiemalis]